MLISGKPWSVVRDRNDGTIIAGHNLDDHPTGLTAMLDHIVNDICNRIEQKVSITGDEHRLIADETDVSASFLKDQNPDAKLVSVGRGLLCDILDYLPAS